MIQDRAEQLASLTAATGIDARKVAYAAITQIQGKPELWPVIQANPGSCILSIIQACEQGLDFSKPNEVHLVPYKGKSPRITLQRGYKGWLKLARRAPGVLDVEAFDVRENDQYERSRGVAGEMTFVLPPFGMERGKLLGFCAYALLEGRRCKFEEMTVSEVEAHARRFTKAQEFGPFAGIERAGQSHENFVIYGLKTVIIRLCGRQLDLTSDTGTAIEQEFEPERAAIAEVAAGVPTEARVVEAGPIETLDALRLTHGAHRGREIVAISTDELVAYLEAYGSTLAAEERNSVQQCIFDRGTEVTSG